MKQTTKQINWSSKEKIQLCDAILSLENIEETKMFLRDLMTEAEIEEFSNRLEAARMLSENVPYSTINDKTGLSSTTIARISRWLFGNIGGYRLILERLKSK